MNILTSTFTKKNLKIISKLEERPLHIRELAEQAHVSPGKVQTTVKFFVKTGLATEKREKNRKIIKMNNSNPLLIKIKALINTQQILQSDSIKKLMGHGKVGIFGSFAKGTNDEGSDVDLWIYTEKKQIDLAGLVRNLEKEIKRKVDLTVLNKTKLEHIMKNDPEFYAQLKFTSTCLNGDIFV
jgi:predicted nucleotidyltransferase